MTKDASDYLRLAKECAEMAEHASPENKIKLLEIADTWMELARIAKKDGEPPKH